MTEMDLLLWSNDSAMIHKISDTNVAKKVSLEIIADVKQWSNE